MTDQSFLDEPEVVKVVRMYRMTADVVRKFENAITSQGNKAGLAKHRAALDDLSAHAIRVGGIGLLAALARECAVRNTLARGEIVSKIVLAAVGSAVTRATNTVTRKAARKS